LVKEPSSINLLMVNGTYMTQYQIYCSEVDLKKMLKGLAFRVNQMPEKHLFVLEEE
jgi:hypothetical protein